MQKESNFEFFLKSFMLLSCFVYEAFKLSLRSNSPFRAYHKLAEKHCEDKSKTDIKVNLSTAPLRCLWDGSRTSPLVRTTPAGAGVEIN
jgi:hypothetical protein